ncbi:protein CNGC15b [Amborella trichopoda]|uniref:protein CNGC15b n=1 Tax=Amborella trichopoda TaxID=13333 RepID=UPI0005D301B9|nr:protein CNGC15b [Amborella trichopoda]|eukprot:XP_006846810.2 protein CNGC15b [Amborella trichopoda]
MAMANGKSRSVRFGNDLEAAKFTTYKPENNVKPTTNIKGTQILDLGLKKEEQKSAGNTSRSLKSKVLSRVFSEDYERIRRKVLDPRGPSIHKWNKIFLVGCLVSLFVDPLFFYLPSTRTEACIEIGIILEIALTTIRTITDLLYMIHIYIQFRTAFIAPSSRVFGRGELVIDPMKIADRYLARGFFIDVIAALPLPQILIWGIIPALQGSAMANTRNVLRFIIIFQYLPRLYLIFPLSSQIVKATGVVTETAWAGAAYNLMLYMLASHVLGACWYLLAIERQDACWKSVCRLESPACQYGFFQCKIRDVDEEASRSRWFQSSNITSVCSTTSNLFDFGIYGDAITYSVTSAKFLNKYFYCLWWGLRELSSLGQALVTSTYVGEIAFAILVAILGLVLFGLLIGNMQTYLQSTTARLEEWRIKRTDTEEWMRHRQLPQELRNCIRRYDQYKWMATRGVDEEALLKGLPMDLRRDIKRHLCLDLVRRVPLFDEMDDRMLDAICERLRLALCTEGTHVVREGDPLDHMLFVIRGHLESSTTNGGRTGFFNTSRLSPGDFCGEELLTWALDPTPAAALPASTRTIKALVEVEAFALGADDLKFVAAQFRRLHSKQLRHRFRFYSHQWRTWAACFIQATWRRHKKRQNMGELWAMEEGSVPVTLPKMGFAEYASRLAASVRKTGPILGLNGSTTGSGGTLLQKPSEPDFGLEAVAEADEHD